MTPVHPSDRPVNQTGSPTSSGPMSSGDKPQVPQKPAASPPPQSFSACPVLSGTPATISPTPVPTGRGWAWPALTGWAPSLNKLAWGRKAATSPLELNPTRARESGLALG